MVGVQSRTPTLFEVFVTTIIIVKNQTANEVFLEDIGIGIPASPGQETLSELFTIHELIASMDLRSAIAVGDLIVNDGSQDLDTASALDQVNLETKYEDRTNPDTVAAIVMLDTTNFNTILAPADDTAQKALDTLDNHSHSGGGTGTGWSVGSIAPITPTNGDGWFNTTTNLLYIYDIVNTQWISTTRESYLFTYKSKIEGKYLKIGDVKDSDAAYLIPRDAVITSITFNSELEENPVNKVIELQDSNDAIIYSFIAINGIYSNANLNIDLTALDTLRMYVVKDGDKIKNPISKVEVAWRV